MEFSGGDLVAIFIAIGNSVWTGGKSFFDSRVLRGNRIREEFDIEVKGPLEKVLNELDDITADIETCSRTHRKFDKKKLEALALSERSRKSASELSRVLNKIHMAKTPIFAWEEFDAPFRDHHAEQCDHLHRSKDDLELNEALAKIAKSQIAVVDLLRVNLRKARQRIG
jgi:hypothetical protein